MSYRIRSFDSKFRNGEWTSAGFQSSCPEWRHCWTTQPKCIPNKLPNIRNNISTPSDRTAKPVMFTSFARKLPNALFLWCCCFRFKNKTKMLLLKRPTNSETTTAAPSTKTKTIERVASSRTRCFWKWSFQRWAPETKCLLLSPARSPPNGAKQLAVSMKQNWTEKKMKFHLNRWNAENSRSAGRTLPCIRMCVPWMINNAETVATQHVQNNVLSKSRCRMHCGDTMPVNQVYLVDLFIKNKCGMRCDAMFMASQQCRVYSLVFEFSISKLDKINVCFTTTISWLLEFDLQLWMWSLRLLFSIHWFRYFHWVCYSIRFNSVQFFLRCIRPSCHSKCECVWGLSRWNCQNSLSLAHHFGLKPQTTFWLLI